MLTRIIPRILTIAGHERLMGGDLSSDNRFVKGKATFTDGTEEITRNRVYPDALRSTTTGKAKPPKRLQTMGQAWQDFNDSGRYLQYERCVQEQAARENVGGASPFGTFSQGSSRGRAFAGA